MKSQNSLISHVGLGKCQYNFDKPKMLLCGSVNDNLDKPKKNHSSCSSPFSPSLQPSTWTRWSTTSNDGLSLLWWCYSASYSRSTARWSTPPMLSLWNSLLDKPRSAEHVGQRAWLALRMISATLRTSIFVVEPGFCSMALNPLGSWYSDSFWGLKFPTTQILMPLDMIWAMMVPSKKGWLLENSRNKHECFFNRRVYKEPYVAKGPNILQSELHVVPLGKDIAYRICFRPINWGQVYPDLGLMLLIFDTICTHPFCPSGWLSTKFSGQSLAHCAFLLCAATVTAECALDGMAIILGCLLS